MNENNLDIEFKKQFPFNNNVYIKEMKLNQY